MHSSETGFDDKLILCGPTCSVNRGHWATHQSFTIREKGGQALTKHLSIVAHLTLLVRNEIRCANAMTRLI